MLALIGAGIVLFFLYIAFGFLLGTTVFIAEAKMEETVKKEAEKYKNKP